MLEKSATIIIFIAITSLLVWFRFQTQPTEAVKILRVENSSTYFQNQILKRGQTIETKKGERVELIISSNISSSPGGVDDAIISIDENSVVTIEKTFVTNREIILRTGRIEVVSRGSLIVKAGDTSTTVLNSNASFVNYNFKDIVSVIVLSGKIKTQIQDSFVELSAPDAINIVNSDASTIKHFIFDKNINAVSAFYVWTDK